MDNKISIPDFNNLEVNVSNTERVVSLLSGSLMLYDSLAKKPKKYPQLLLSAFMIFRGVTGHCPGYKLADKKKDLKVTSDSNIKVTITINKPVAFVYQFWRKLENLPLFMNYLESVTILDDEISEWKAVFPGNLGHLNWKAAIIKDIENKEIVWRSFSESWIHNIGKVEFHDNQKFGTKINVLISYRTPLGKSGEMITNVLNPFFENMIEQDIKRFKEYIENK